jgi:predicted O-methyltransferase YrrM
MEFSELAPTLTGFIDVCARPGGRQLLYDFVRSTRPARILELGFAHGGSTCAMAAALAANGSGHIVTIDRKNVLERHPNIYELLDATGLRAWVEPIVGATSYTWELMKLIDAASLDGRCQPQFDFCFVDGSHCWEADGCAFFLVEKLLRPAGWILFDDLDWTFDTSATLKDLPEIRAMPDDERSTPQIGKVFDLLVRQHPAFDLTRIEGPWGWAHKRGVESVPRRDRR